MADWSSAQYLKFEDDRTRPAAELLRRVLVAAPRRVVDIGCGPGNSTELLAERFPHAAIEGFDTSANMLEAARARLPAAHFFAADATHWTPSADTDVVFANAIFQWVPDHLTELSRIFEALPSGAVLAVQMPDNTDEPTHRLMEEVVRADGPWSAAAGHVRRRPRLPTPDAYYDGLKPVARTVDVWHTIYNHVLDDAAAIVEWVKGTGLKPFIDPLGEPERAAYLAAYTARIAEAYPPRADGKVLLRFPRLFVVAERL